MLRAEKLVDEGEEDTFMLACNRPECDENWEDASPTWLGRASMSQRHRFMLIKRLEWRWFNVLSFGMGGTSDLAEAIDVLKRMKVRRPRDACMHAHAGRQAGRVSSHHRRAQPDETE